MTVITLPSRDSPWPPSRVISATSPQVELVEIPMVELVETPPAEPVETPCPFPPTLTGGDSHAR